MADNMDLSPSLVESLLRLLLKDKTGGGPSPLSVEGGFFPSEAPLDPSMMPQTAGGIPPTPPPAPPPALPGPPQRPPGYGGVGDLDGHRLSFPPGSLTDQLNRIGAEGDAISGGPGINELNPIPRRAPFTPEAPPPPLVDSGQQSYPGSMPMRFPPPPAGDVGPQEPSIMDRLNEWSASQPLGQDSYPGSMPTRFPEGPAQGLGPATPALPERPERRPGYGGADELHMHDPRTPGEQEAVAGQPPAVGELPAAPEKEGDLSRGRASRELQRLLGMQEMAEGLGNMEVVTTGDILHRTAKGMGTKPRFKAEGLRGLIGMEADRDAALYKHGLNLEEIKARGEAATKTGLATRAPARLSPTERGEWRGAQVAVSELNEILQTKIDKNYNTGPLANAFEDLAAFVGMEWFGFAEKQEFKYRAARIVREYIFALSGKQTSGQERKDLMKLVPRGRDDDELFEFKIRGFQAFLKKKQNVLLESQPAATIETENMRRMMDEEDKSDPYFHRRGGGPVYQIEAKGVEGGFFDVDKKDWEELMANPSSSSLFRAVPLAPKRKP